MSMWTFRNFAARALRSTHRPMVRFIFHGGEPTLLSDDWFSEAVHFARDLAKQFDKRAEFTLQTNLVKFDAHRAMCFKDLGIALGVSVDGPTTVPAPMRKKAEAVIENLRLAMAVGVQTGVLMTINHSNWDRFSEIMSWLEDDLHVRSFKANVVSSVGRGYYLSNLAPEQVFAASRDILEGMIRRCGEGALEDNLSFELRRFFASAQERPQLSRTLCQEQRCGAGETVLGVTPAGDLLPCGRFQWDDHSYYLGSASLPPSEDLLRKFNQQIERFHSLVPESWYDCPKCPARNVCTFGCQAFIVRSKKQANVDCLPTKMRYSYYSANVTRLMPVVEAIRSRRPSTQPLVTDYSDYKDGGTYPDAPGYRDDYNDAYKDNP